MRPSATLPHSGPARWGARCGPCAVMLPVAYVWYVIRGVVPSRWENHADARTNATENTYFAYQLVPDMTSWLSFMHRPSRGPCRPTTKRHPTWNCHRTPTPTQDPARHHRLPANLMGAGTSAGWSPHVRQGRRPPAGRGSTCRATLETSRFCMNHMHIVADSLTHA